jgi:deoxyribodipyrimidine photo-lyase
MSGGLVWFRRDLRLGDNPAWAAATAAHDEVIALYVLDPALYEPGSPRSNYLIVALHALDRSLADHGGRLRVRTGLPVEAVAAEAAGVEAVYWNRDVSPYSVRRDAAVEAGLSAAVNSFYGGLVHGPGTVLTGGGDVYKVFTPFYRRWSDTEWEAWPDAGEARLDSDTGDGLPEPPEPPPAPVGEGAALDRLEAFADRVGRYDEERDRPGLDTTSRLSIDLKYGTLGPRTVASRLVDADAEPFIRQLAWRDFYAHILHAFPATAHSAMRSEYDRIEWLQDPDGLEAWKQGRTGYPIVDAGMRQLAGEHWMHNRVRMITASFLVKDLLIDWRLGERHFRDLLLDGDVPQNVGNWQWVAGTGADAAPYFRIFNPVSQSKKFDPEGGYIRRWVPELAGLSKEHIHAPWEAGPLELAAAGVTLDETYPSPIVDHGMARHRTLDAYRKARGET